MASKDVKLLVVEIDGVDLDDQEEYLLHSEDAEFSDTNFTQTKAQQAIVQANKRVAVSSDDTIPDYLINKINVGSTKLTKTETNPSGNEIVTIDFGVVTIDHLADVDTVTVAPTTGDRLAWNGSEWAPDAAGSFDDESISSTITTRTASTYGIMLDMGITPAAGTYRVYFFGSISNSDGTSDTDYAVFSGGVIHLDSERHLVLTDNKQTDIEVPVSTTAKVTVNGSQSIEVQWRIHTGIGTATSYTRSLVISKVAQ